MSAWILALNLAYLRMGAGILLNVQMLVSTFHHIRFVGIVTEIHSDSTAQLDEWSIIDGGARRD